MIWMKWPSGRYEYWARGGGGCSIGWVHSSWGIFRHRIEYGCEGLVGDFVAEIRKCGQEHMDGLSHIDTKGLCHGVFCMWEVELWSLFVFWQVTSGDEGGWVICGLTVGIALSFWLRYFECVVVCSLLSLGGDIQLTDRNFPAKILW